MQLRSFVPSPLVFVLSLLALGVGARAQCDEQWFGSGSLSGTNGIVRDVVNWDPDGNGPTPEWLVVGGGFTVAGDTYTGGLAAWDGTRWRRVGGVTAADIREVFVFGSDLVVVGSLAASSGATYGGTLRWDGQAWREMNAGSSQAVSALTVHNGRLTGFGRFADTGGSTFLSPAQWDGNAWVPLGGPLGSPTIGTVLALTEFGGNLVAAGIFSSIGGVNAINIAQWDGTVWRPMGRGLSGSFDDIPHVRSLMPFEGGLIAAGVFIQSGSQTLQNIARWDGSNWSPLAEGFLPPVTALGVVGGLLHATGRGTVNHKGVYRFSRWNGQSWQDLSTIDSLCMTPYAGSLALGCFFTQPTNAGLALRVALWDGSSFHTLGSLSTDNLIFTLREYRGELVAGGAFDRIGGQPIRRIARTDGQTWRELDSGVSSNVRVLHEFRGDLIVGGDFYFAGGLPGSNSIAAWDGTAWRTLGVGFSRVGAPAVVQALVEFQSELIAAGTFSSSGGQPLFNIARWDGTSWRPLGSGITGQGVAALAVYNGLLIAGGTFTSAGGVPADDLACWDGVQWRAVTPSALSGVNALAVFDGDLIVAGNLPVLPPPDATTGLARWNGVAWSALGAPSSTTILTLASTPGRLYVGGSSFTIGGTTFGQIAQWDGSHWDSLDSGVAGDGGFGNTYAVVWSITTHGGRLYVGGRFTTAGQAVSVNIAWRECPCYANCNNSVSPTLGIDDYWCFLQAFAGGHAYANCDGSSVPPWINVADFVCFTNRFAQGCP
ncbi:MAG: hypothetical protein ACKVW3_02155 [Phycisphaerales bacterium]